MGGANGLEGIPVELRAPTERLPRMSVTASDGSFSFRGVRGEVSVTALPYDLPPARESIAIGDDALVTVELALASALYTLRGRVLDERGFGVSGALLTVSGDEPADPGPADREVRHRWDVLCTCPAGAPVRAQR